MTIGSATHMSEGFPSHEPDRLEQSVALARRLRSAIGSVIQGKTQAIDTALAVYLAGGHLLLQDVPGVGKTTLAKAIARAVDCPVRRIQFTPDLMPSDITGVNIYDQRRGVFEFRHGAIFASVVVADEINRASPKTQSAVLEAMEENQVTVDGVTYPLPATFFVIATQNPLEMEGTYPLPEAQRDRFMARISMGYPDPATELAMLEAHAADSPLEKLAPVATEPEVEAATEVTRQLHASAALKRYVVDLVAATRTDAQLRLGASPRASLHLLRAARGHALVAGRSHVLPQDVQAMAAPVLAHRVLLSGQARMENRTTSDVIASILAHVPITEAATG